MLLAAMMTACAGTDKGEQYTDIALENENGTVIKVSDYVANNRYTLVDFWASWCPPCRAELPNLVKAYERYHAQGFEIVGVSLDRDHDAWVAAIEKYNLTWPHMSDLKGWQSAGAALYNVRSIPANVLIDSEGYIVATNLRDETLQTTLAELFK